VTADGYDWLLINYDQGCDGWSAEVYLIPVQGGQNTSPTPASTATPSGYIFTRSLSVGMSGGDVTGLQTILQAHGYFNNAITGYFGNITKAALQKFQSDHGLEAVGVVGPKTRALLNQL
jgi:peptidoglycan hydrolase-like protein with peptidoglycan-binding domain